jgi:hypothetical protein
VCRAIDREHRCWLAQATSDQLAWTRRGRRPFDLFEAAAEFAQVEIDGPRL